MTRSLVYDIGALLAAERRGRRAGLATLHEAVTAAGIRPLVPSVVLAQAWRGGPQPQLSIFLKACRVLPVDEATARAAGSACAAAGTSDVVDAIVVVTAAALDAVVVTSDPDDLAHVADALDVELTLHRV